VSEPPHEHRYDVEIDPEICVSAGRCVAEAPSVFVFDADEIATVNAAGVWPSDAVLLRVARQCPSGAISLRRDGNIVEI
jgi:ferredoxin